MSKYLMLGKYSADGIKAVSAERTKKAVDMIEKAGGKVERMYVLLGAHDLAFIVELPGNVEALRVSVELARATGIGFSTSAAITVEEFDRMTG